MSDATAIVSKSVAPVVLYRAPRWPYTATRAKQLDRMQALMVSRALRLPYLPDETAAAFMQRRSRAAGTVCRQQGTLSNSWRRRLENWHAHLCRHPDSWPTRVLRYKDAAWLRDRRVELAGEHVSSLSGRTGTRARVACPAKRWEESLSDF